MEKPPQRKSIRLSREAYGLHNAFFITVATHERYPWFRVHQELAREAIDEMQRLAEQRKTVLWAWCLMPDHFHMLIQDSGVVDFVRSLKGRLSVAGRRIEPGRRLWQRSFHDHGLRQAESVNDVCKYIWENPVRKGLVQTPEEYPWSGGKGFRDVHVRG